MIKIILAALCANLLYTNSNLMIAATANLQPWAAFLMVAFALTYSLISTVAVFKVKSPVAVAVFAILDGFAVYTHLAPHDEAFPVTVAAYFGIYTTYTLCICFSIRKAETGTDNADKIEGHDVKYWYNCFLYQKQRAEADKNPVKEIETPTPPPQAIETPTPKAEIAPPSISDEDRAQIISIRRAFNRMTDPDKRRERIKDLPDNIKTTIKQLYGL